MSGITKFFGAVTSSNNGENSEPMPKKTKASGVPQTASLKTVRKWEKELESSWGKSTMTTELLTRFGVRFVKNRSERIERIDHLQ